MKYILILFFITSSLLSFGQEKLIEELVADIRSSTEVIFLGGTVKGKYRGVWLQNFKYEGGFLIFSDGEKEEKWNPNKVSHVIKDGLYLKVYADELTTQH